MPPRVARRGYDILIAGEPYVYGPPELQGGMRLGVTPRLGVSNASPGTIVIPSFHHGYGQEIAGDPSRAFTIVGLDVSVPGRIFLSGGNTTYGPQNDAYPLRKYYGSLHYDDATDMILAVTERKLFRTKPATGAQALAALRGGDVALSGNEAFRGSLFQWQNHQIVGIADDMNYAGFPLPDRSKGFAFWDVPTDIYDTEYGHAEDHSFGDSNRGRCVYAFNSGAQGAPNEIDFSLSLDERFGDAAGGYTKFGPFQELGMPRLGWVKMVGSTLLIMREDGSVLSVDESTGGLALVAENLHAVVGEDAHFGWHPKMYLDSLVFPGFGHIWSFNLGTLTITDITPNKLQDASTFPAQDWPAAGTHAVAVRGDELWIVSVSAADDTKFVITRGKPYKDGFHYQTWFAGRPADGIDLDKSKEIHDAIIVRDGDDAGLWVLWRPTSGGTLSTAWLTKWDLPATDWSTVPASWSASTGTLTGSRYAGDGSAAGALKRFLQFRGYYHVAAGTPHTLKVSIDDAAAITLSSTITDGVQAIAFPNTVASVGRNIQPIFEITATGQNYAAGPWAIDFIWTPEYHDAVSFALFASNEYQGIRKSARDIFDELDALRHTVVTIKFPHDVEWTVFIESVSAREVPSIPGMVSGEGSMMVDVSARRLA
jgi:hypothetical protein